MKKRAIMIRIDDEQDLKLFELQAHLGEATASKTLIFAMENYLKLHYDFLKLEIKLRAQAVAYTELLGSIQNLEGAIVRVLEQIRQGDLFDNSIEDN